MQLVPLYIPLLIWFSGILQAQVNIDSLARASLSREDSTNIRIVPLKINSGQSDYSPQVSGNMLYFVSDRNRHVGVQYVDMNKSTNLTDIYVAKKRDSLRFGKPALLKAASSSYHEGPFCFSQDGSVMLITANNREGSNKIYRLEKIKGKWSAPEMLPFCNEPYMFCHPALSHDGKLLAFSSDIPGYGGMDLYFSELKGGLWSAPVNAGKSINSSGNEVFPYFGPDNNLYFSSNKAGGYGGLDIYLCRMADTSLPAAILDPPLNSAGDDFGIWLDPSPGEGYFTSNRKGSARDDIYYFSRIIPDFSNAPEPEVKTSFCYNFFEETSLGNHDTTNLEFEWEMGDGQKKRGLHVRHCYSAPGEYTVKLNVVERTSGEIFNSLVEYPLIVSEPEKLYISCDETVMAGDTITVNCLNSAIKGYDIGDIYWCFGDGRYNSGEVVGHVYRAPGTYNLQLWVNAISKKTGRKEKFKTHRTITVREK
jgi:hypothetical protein